MPVGEVVPLVLEQVSTVNTGAANAGVVLLGVTVDVILPVALAFRFVYAEIRNRIVAPGSTLVADFGIARALDAGTAPRRDDHL